MKILIISFLLFLTTNIWAENLNLVCDVTVKGKLDKYGEVNQKTKASISFQEGTLGGVETNLGKVRLMDIELEGELTKSCRFEASNISCLLYEKIYTKATDRELLFRESLDIERKTGFVRYKLWNNLNKLNDITFNGQCKKATDNKF